MSYKACESGEGVAHAAYEAVPRPEVCWRMRGGLIISAPEALVEGVLASDSEPESNKLATPSGLGRVFAKPKSPNTNNPSWAY